MPHLSPGDAAPHFTLPTVQGGTVDLADALQSSEALLLVFLRHLG